MIPAAPVSNQRLSSAPHAAVPPTIPTAAAAQDLPTPEDPVAALAEAVSQLKLALAAFNGSAATAPPNARATARGAVVPPPLASDTTRDSRGELAAEIAATQDQVAAFLASRRAGMFGNAGFAAYSDASVPFAASSFSDASECFAEQTSEPEF